MLRCFSSHNVSLHLCLFSLLISISLHLCLFFCSSLLLFFSRLSSSLVLSSCLLVFLSSSVLLFFSSSCVLFHLLLSLLFHLLFSIFRLFFSLFRLVVSSFSVSLCLSPSLSPCVVLCGVVWCCFVLCVVCGVRCCGVRRWRTSVCTFKTSPCIPAPRPHVETHVRVVPANTGTF